MSPTAALSVAASPVCRNHLSPATEPEIYCLATLQSGATPKTLLKETTT